MNPKEHNNNRVWKQFLIDGSDKLFSTIYSYYVDKLYSYGISLGFDSEICKDAIQDVFMKIYSSRTIIDNISNPASFLFQSFKNRLIDIARKNKNEFDIDISHIPFTVDVTILDDIIDKERSEILKTKVRNILDNLSDTQREAVYLRYIAEMDYSEISDRLNIKQESARKLIYRAIKSLREQNFEELSEVTLIVIMLLLV